MIRETSLLGHVNWWHDQIKLQQLSTHGEGHLHAGFRQIASLWNERIFSPIRLYQTYLHIFYRRNWFFWYYNYHYYHYFDFKFYFYGGGRGKVLFFFKFKFHSTNRYSYSPTLNTFLFHLFFFFFFCENCFWNCGPWLFHSAKWMTVSFSPDLFYGCILGWFTKN